MVPYGFHAIAMPSLELQSVLLNSRLAVDTIHSHSKRHSFSLEDLQNSYAHMCKLKNS